MKQCNIILVCLLITHTYCKHNKSNVMDPISKEESRKKYFTNYERVKFNHGLASDPNQITYKLFTKDNPNEEILLTEENVASKNLTKHVKTILFMHGWKSNDSSPWFQPLKEAYFQNGPYNIIYVNWQPYGNLSYLKSSANVKPVGKMIARVLQNSGVPAKNIHLVGHSLGAQLAGFIGKGYEKTSGEKVGRITALDPAGPRWSDKKMKTEKRLCESDADFVDVVHTNIQFYGYRGPCGHVDFYPNGGANQPGCLDEDEKDHCSHHRSTWLFIESVNTQAKATEINFKEDKKNKIVITPKDNPKQVIFGEHISLQDKGVYFLETNSNSPFLKLQENNILNKVFEKV